MSRLPRLLLALLAPSLVLVAGVAQAGVTRLEIVRREVVLNGQAFGAAGPYEKLVGRVHFALDPRLPQNQGIVDLGLAAKNAQGLVEFSADFYLLKPVDPGRGNGRLFYEAGNRGSKRDPAGVPERRRLRRSDHRRRVRQRRADAPGLHAAVDGMAVGRAGGTDADGHPDRHRHGQPITGLVRGNFIPGANATVAAIADRNHEAYPVVDPDSYSAEHVLYVRTLPSDAPQVVPRARWRFASAGTITLDGGFSAGRIYDVVYRARDPRVVGVGLSGTRDLVSFFKHASAAEGNPMPGVRLAIGWGVSQTGRFLRHFVYQGFNEDERGRIVFDGVFDQVGGAGRGSFNHRFGQQSRDQLQHFNIQYPVDMFPFTDETETDPVTGQSDGLLERARRSNTVPKMVHLLTNSEYFNRAGSLVHTDVTGSRDVAPPDTSRIYMVASAPHIVGAFPPGPFGDKDFVGQAAMNPLVYAPVLRAVFRALDAWVADGTAPPPSRHPRLADGTLVAPDAAGWPAVPGVRLPAAPMTTYRLDFGPDWSQGDRHQGTARAGPAVREPRAGGGRGRQRPRRHPPAADRGAARHPHRLELPPAVDRRAGSPGQRDRLVPAAAAHQGRSRTDRRRPALDRRALCQPRGLPGPDCPRRARPGRRAASCWPKTSPTRSPEPPGTRTGRRDRAGRGAGRLGHAAATRTNGARFAAWHAE